MMTVMGAPSLTKTILFILITVHMCMAWLYFLSALSSCKMRQYLLKKSQIDYNVLLSAYYNAFE